jgi:multisubunit Na+/H+ antiporter MnhG subunit
MHHRPRSVTFIAWLIIIFGSFGLLSVLATLFLFIINPVMKAQFDAYLLQDPIPLPLQYSLLCINNCAPILYGSAMLAGKNWARMLYAGLSILSIIIAFLFRSSQNTAVPSKIVTLIILFFLFRPAANRYFSRALSN